MSQSGEPDADAIKMFVGQIPRVMDECAVKQMFEEYGAIHNMNILRDKATGASKGCAFITFFTRKSAIDAQNALHNTKTMPLMHHPIQMKPADSEKKGGDYAEDRKLFIGMLCKKSSESDVRSMFSPFGAIEECTVLRDSTGTASKGCAFVTYATRACATNAIKGMHQSQTMESCSSPLVVKWADTQKEKEQRKSQHMNTNMWNNGGGGGGGAPGASCFAGNAGNNHLAQLLQQLVGVNHANSNMGAGNFGNQGMGGNQMGGVNLQQLLATAAAAAGNNPALLATLASLGSMIANGNHGHGGQQGMNPGVGNNQGGFRGNQFGMGNNSGGLGNNMGGGNSMNGFGSNNSNSIDALTQAYSGIQQYAAAFPNSFGGNQTAMNNNATIGKQSEGPDGANLFIYHLPQESTDQDLMSMFSPFGSVISAKVFIDKQTNLSKCFGFVSYDNSASAANAIQSMNGFQLGMKRLKVQLKRPKNDGKPY